MAIPKEQKRKAKRKAKQKQRISIQATTLVKAKANNFYQEALWYYREEDFDESLTNIKAALQYTPNNEKMLKLQVSLGNKLHRTDIELKGMFEIYKLGRLPDEMLLDLGRLLYKHGRYKEAIRIVDTALPLIPKMKIKGKNKTVVLLKNLRSWCEDKSQIKEEPLQRILQAPSKKPQPGSPSEPTASASTQVEPVGESPLKEEKAESILPEPAVSLTIASDAFQKAIVFDKYSSPDKYKLALDGYRIRFRESFENLVILSTLQNVRSFWYQEETAKKVLKMFRGRALLADEVGLGKTIEALIVFKEYVHRGMVKSALILTPTPLVSQWRDELKTKFGFDIPSTDDENYSVRGDSFWKEPFILSSINIAKSNKNFSQVTEREYDMVIVDEAHHLKNRNTLNWKLVNALKKRFLLLLTATPVANNLMELYNLITLLKPGQLKTAAAFKAEFMTRGDPTDPRNRSKLKELLGQVMIRNTRAVAKLDIPPRIASTIRVEPSAGEKSLYERVCRLAKSINAAKGAGRKFLIKNLLAEAGSSPQALSITLTRVLEKRELLLDQENEIRAIITMCRTMGDTSKNKMVLKLIRNASDKIIIFVKFLGTLEYLSAFLERNNISYALFHGGMPNRQKDEQIELFREERDILLTTEVGGEGRNLHFCHQMINYDLPWNPMKIEQRIGRLHRIGQLNEVMIYNLCAAGSVEDYILDVLDRKINMFELVIGEIDMILGRIRGEQDFSDLVYDIWINAPSVTERDKLFNQLADKLKRSKTGYQKTKVLDEKLFGENYEL